MDSDSISKDDKHQVDTHSSDSGFISGSNFRSSELSEDFDYDSKGIVAPEPAKATDSGLDLGLTTDLKDLSLKEVTQSETFDSGIISQEFPSEILDLEKVSTELHAPQSEKCTEESKEPENWETFYTQDDDGDTELHVCIFQGFVEGALYLIDIAPHPILLNILNDDAQAALHVAVLTRQPAIVRRLILAGADPTVRNFQGNTPLHISCERGDVSCVKALTSPLMAAEHKFYEAAKELPVVPQNLEQKNYEGKTCLHIAAIKGHLEIVRHLLEVGADPTAREGLAGYTPLQLAIEHNQKAVFDFLAKSSRLDQLETENYARLTAYQVAYMYGKENFASELVKLGAKPSVPPALLTDEDSDEEDDEDEEEMCEKYGMSPLSQLDFGPQTLPAFA